MRKRWLWVARGTAADPKERDRRQSCDGQGSDRSGGRDRGDTGVYVLRASGRPARPSPRRPRRPAPSSARARSTCGRGGCAAGRSRCRTSAPTRRSAPCGSGSRCAAAATPTRRRSGRSSPSRAGRATARSPAPATTSTCSGRCFAATTWCWSTCAAPDIRARSTARSSRGAYGTDREGVAQCARILGDHVRAPTGPRPPPTTSTTSARALGLGRIDLYGDSYGTFLAQSYAYRHGDSLAALVLDSAYPVRGESPWYPSLWRTGSGRCRSPATAPPRARATRTAAWAAWSRCCVGRPVGSGRCSTRSPPAATSPRCATSSRSTRRSAPTCTATAGPTSA